MQARLLERPQQVNSMNSRAISADPPRKPATTRPSTYPPVEMFCIIKESFAHKLAKHPCMQGSASGDLSCMTCSSAALEICSQTADAVVRAYIQLPVSVSWEGVLAELVPADPESA